MSRKPKSKLPAGWDVYTAANSKPVKRSGVWRRGVWWKYVPWVLLLSALAAVAFYPWQF